MGEPDADSHPTGDDFETVSAGVDVAAITISTPTQMRAAIARLTQQLTSEQGRLTEARELLPAEIANRYESEDDRVDRHRQ